MPRKLCTALLSYGGGGGGGVVWVGLYMHCTSVIWCSTFHSFFHTVEISVASASELNILIFLPLIQFDLIHFDRRKVISLEDIS